ncbi:low affinity potassium transporter [Orbilia blumenaviensis]|uniref:Potassium transport protein n=1 Tax=Orbilia blumenaviensis TaxID=1796055 RepID=A0AAV9UXX6_9PEZI
MWDFSQMQWPNGFVRRPRLNFITLHYLYIIGWAIVGSILLYPLRNLPYVDCLFHATGASTQSGLNTVDLNTLATYQQIILMLVPWVTNPIVINTGVVFIRLYWFEKRFDSVVEQSKTFVLERRTMSRRKSESDGADRAERGVAGRTITVLLNSARRSGQPEKTEDQTTSGNKDLQEFRKNHLSSGGNGPSRPINFPKFRSHGRSRSDANHQWALRQSKPGTLFTDSNNDNDHEFAIEDDDETPQRPPLSPAPNTELSGILEKGGETSAPVHISFAEPKTRKRKDSEVLVVPTPYDVENRGSGLARRFVDGEDEDEGKGPKDEEHLPPVPESPGHVKRAITIDVPTMTHNTMHSGPRQRIRPATSRASADQHYMHTPISPGIHRVFSDVIRRRRGSSPSRKSTKIADPMPYLSYTPTIGRNSQFNYGELSDEQKEELGGVEYRSLRTLGYILVGYFLFFQVFGVICVLPWIHTQMRWAKVVDDASISRTWWAIFTSSSAFTDLGFTLTPDSMLSFQTATWLLLLMSYLIIIGNTGFPCMLRFIIWSLWKLCPSSWVAKESLHFLLDHPRRCFTLLFPSNDTWWLFGVLVVMNTTDVILFIVLDLNNSAITSLSVNHRILDAYFQAVSTRTAGFSVVNLSALHPAVQVSYLIMMYISVFPIAISVRKTNVYEERSLGIYADHEENDNPNDHSFVGAHLRKQLSFDLWYVFLGLFAICIAEGSRISDPIDYAFNQFTCLFEVISAYGTVGLSLGYPDVNTSFSGQLTSFSKIVILAMMVRGRHRGLPYELDRAILLPSESLQQKEEEDAALRLQRRIDTQERAERRSLRSMSRGPSAENANGGVINGAANSGATNGNANGGTINGTANGGTTHGNAKPGGEGSGVATGFQMHGTAT